MSDTQILTIALAAVPTMLAVLVGILINNSRLSDTNARIADLRGHMDACFVTWITDLLTWITDSTVSTADSTKCAISGARSFIVLNR
jgi:hypothetical protein